MAAFSTPRCSIARVLTVLGAVVVLWPRTYATADDAERQLTAVEAARLEAKQHGDTRRLDELLAPDFIRINRFGRLLGKRQTIAIARDPHYATVDVQLRIYDNGAVVTGRESVESEPPGRVRFLRVWIRDGDNWRDLTEEETRISSEPEAARLAKTRPSTGARTIIEGGSDTNHVAEAAEATDETARDVRHAERRYHDAERLNDLATLSMFRAPEFRIVDRLGDVRTSTMVVPTIKAAQEDDFSVRVHKNIAIAIGSVLRTNLRNGATDRFRYSTIWVQHDGRWSVVAEQRTAIE